MALQEAALTLVATSLLSGINTAPHTVDEVIKEVDHKNNIVKQNEEKAKKALYKADNKVKDTDNKVKHNLGRSKSPRLDLRSEVTETKTKTKTQKAAKTVVTETKTVVKQNDLRSAIDAVTGNNEQEDSPQSSGNPVSPNAETWDRLAQCESGGDWHINTGNGYQGGLQWLPSTFAAYGGNEFASSPAEATREEEMIVADRLLAATNGKYSQSWPSCSAQLGLP